MTVLNGADGVNGMLGGIFAQVGTLQPQLTSSLRKKDESTGQNGSRPLAAPAAEGPNARPR